MTIQSPGEGTVSGGQYSVRQALEMEPDHPHRSAHGHSACGLGGCRDGGRKGPGLLVTILLLRRIPVVLLLKRFVGQLRTWNEALFVGRRGRALFRRRGT
jgi:hypothetical protein